MIQFRNRQIEGICGVRYGVLHRTSMFSLGTPPFKHLDVFTNLKAL